MALKQPVVLPPNRAWTQPNTGNIFGSIYSTRNVDLSVAGVASLSRRMQYVGRENTSGSSFDYLLSVIYDGQALATASVRYWYITSDKIYRTATDLSAFTIDNIASSPSLFLGSDGLMWNDGMYVTTTSNMSKLVGGAWTGSLMALTTGLPHPLCVSTINDYLLVGNGNVLKKRTTAGVNTDALTLPSNYRIQWIRSDNARVLIGCRDLNGDSGAVFDWDEVAAAATNKYDIDADWPLSGDFRNTDFFLVTNDGRLQKYNGGGFGTVAQWVVYRTLEGEWVNGFTNGTVMQRGLGIIDGKVSIMINGEIDNGYNDSPLYENMASGIWEFSEDTGLNHKYGLSVSQTGTDYAQMVLSGAGAIGAIVTDPIVGAPDPSTQGSILLTGGRLSDGTANEFYTLCTVVKGTNRGEITSTRIETVDIADQSMKLWCKFRGLWTSEDKLIFKYKDYTKQGLPFTTVAGVTWSSNVQFTSSSTYWQYASMGDEVTVTSGKGAGAAAHIASISLNAGTYTVVLDEAIPNVINTDVSQVICDNFTKLETQADLTSILGYVEVPIPQPNPRTWIEVKTEMRGSEYVTIEELQLVTASHVFATS